jgi:hypothetical protein
MADPVHLGLQGGRIGLFYDEIFTAVGQRLPTRYLPAHDQAA